MMSPSNIYPQSAWDFATAPFGLLVKALLARRLPYIPSLAGLNLPLSPLQPAAGTLSF